MFNVTPSIDFHLELLFSNYSLLKSVQKLGYRKLVFHGKTRTIGIFETPQRKTCIIPSTPKQFGNRFSSTFQRWFSGRQNVGPTPFVLSFPKSCHFSVFFGFNCCAQTLRTLVPRLIDVFLLHPLGYKTTILGCNRHVILGRVRWWVCRECRDTQLP